MPNVRAALVAIHIVAVLLLSLPSSQRVLKRQAWERPSTQQAFGFIADHLHWLGIDSKEDFERRLWRFVEGYVAVRDEIVRPFEYYPRLAGVRQGWSVFSRPRERPVELEIAVDESHGFQPIYRPHSRKYDFWSRKLRQYRFRKVTGHLARRFNARVYNSLTKLLAKRALQAYPDTQRVRVRLYRYETLPAAELRAGEEPPGEHIHTRIYQARTLR